MAETITLEVRINLTTDNTLSLNHLKAVIEAQLRKIPDVEDFEIDTIGTRIATRKRVSPYVITVEEEGVSLYFVGKPHLAGNEPARMLTPEYPDAKQFTNRREAIETAQRAREIYPALYTVKVHTNYGLSSQRSVDIR